MIGSEQLKGLASLLIVDTSDASPEWYPADMAEPTTLNVLLNDEGQLSISIL